MSNEEILEKAIQQAISNGWKYKGHNITSLQMLPFLEEFIITTDHQDDIHNVGFIEWALPYYYIFNHDFAKALWGEEPLPTTITVNGEEMDTFSTSYFKGWQYYLQQMVIVDEPIQYLGEHI